MAIALAIMVWAGSLSGVSDAGGAGPGTVRLVEQGAWTDPAGTNIRAVQVADGYAYLADQSWGLRIISVEGVVEPFQVGLFANPWVKDVYTVSELVYLVDNSSFKTVGAGDPTSPIQQCRITVSGGLTRVFGDDGWVYAIGGSIVKAVYGDSLQNVFISERTVQDACIQGDEAYLVTSSGSTGFVTILDVVSPLDWQVRGSSISFSPAAQALVVSGDLIFIANGSGLRVRSTGDLSYITGINTPGFAYDVWVDDHYAYVADSEAGVAVFELGNPDPLSQVASYDTPGTAQDLFVDGRYIYVADGTGGLRILLLNHTAVIPEAVSPRDGTKVDSLTPTLTAAFYDADGDVPDSVTWQVYADGFTADFGAFDLDEGGNLVGVVPEGIGLEYDKTYWWRVGCTVPYEDVDLWSEWASFVTPEGPHPLPEAPVAVSPQGGERVDSLTPVLRAVFSTADGNEPVSTQWAVYNDQPCTDFLIGSGPLNGAVQYAVPTDVLSYDTTYWWRVRCRDSYGAESPWSVPVSFTTPVEPQEPPILEPSDPPPPAPRHRSSRPRQEPRTVPAPPPFHLWQQGMVTVSFDPYRLPAMHRLRLLTPFIPLNSHAGGLNLCCPGGLVISLLSAE